MVLEGCCCVDGPARGLLYWGQQNKERYEMEKQERREFIRVPFRTSLAIRTQDRTIWSTSSLDISMTGLRASTQETPPAEGTAC